jgi:nicotinate-nucleotide--dimethylbenzimidazole phosphoribosyltransferase
VDDYLQGFSMGDVNIVPTDKIIAGLIQAEIDQKTKPLASLGKVETLALQLGVIYQTKSPRISKPVVFICAGNHGITRQGVSAYPSEVTAQMLLNFKNGGAAINVLAKTFGLEVEIVNAGVDVSTIEHLGDMNLPVANTTQDFLSQDAMTSMQCEAAIALGYKRALECIEAGTNFVLLGEMGIGNTSAAAIITSLMTGFPLDTCVGRGTGLGEQALKVKQQTLSAAIEFHGREHEPMTVLRKFGGLEIAALVGIIFAATQSGCAVLVDGFITTSAALIAVALQPNVSDYLIFSHLSKEPGHRIALDHLAGTAILSLDLCLGEGSGAAIAFPIVKAASEILCDMATFESAAVATAKSGVQ